MTRKFFLCPCLFSFLLLLFSSPSSAAPSASGLIKKLHDKNDSLKSYSFTAHRFDLADSFVLRRNDDGLKSYKSIIDKLSFLTRQSKDVSKGASGYKESLSTVLFAKPFSVQLTMDKSQFVPSFLQRATVIYRPDINGVNIFLKDPYLGMLIRQDINNESSIVLISNWTYELMEMDCAIANGGKATLSGASKVDGKNTYILDVSLKKGKIPWAVGCGGAPADIPSNAYIQLNRELGMMADRIDKFREPKAYIRYWVDTASTLIVKKEVRFGKTTAIRYTLSDIKLNSLKPDDFVTIKEKE